MGEFDVIAQYFTRPPKKALLGGGDDCALLQLDQGMVQCISSDMLIEGRHFFSTVSPYRLGVKALAVNLSDLAACGATPSAFTLAISLPEINTSWLESFSDGLWDTADEYSIDLIGGDTTKGPLSICITVFGAMPANEVLLRSGAKVGDDIYVSGTLGDARLALEVFKGSQSLDRESFERVRMRLEQPTPRINLGVALRRIANSCIDISDGLVGDLGHILKRSNVGATLRTDWIHESAAISQDLQRLEVLKRLDYVLSGGDDYELLFTASPHLREQVAIASHKSLTPVTRIGTVTAELGLRVLDLKGEIMSQEFSSFDHFHAAS